MPRRVIIYFLSTPIFVVARIIWKFSWYHDQFLYVLFWCGFMDIECGFLRLWICNSGTSIRSIHSYPGCNIIVYFLYGDCTIFVFLIVFYFSILSALNHFTSLILCFIAVTNAFMKCNTKEGKSRNWIKPLNPEEPMIIFPTCLLSLTLILYFFLLGYSWFKFQLLVYLYWHIHPSSPPKYASFLTSLIIHAGGFDLIYLIPLK